jgi:LysR family nod box-dependent transcriptional activator
MASLRGVDLNLLVTLEALLRERNVTRAGRLMGASQPAMSAALARLREMFDDRLLVRVGREYQLTPLARDLLGPLQNSLSSLQNTLERKADFDPRTSQREFCIAAADYSMVVLIQPLITHLQEIAPGIRLHLRNADTQLPRRLASGRVDLSVQPAGVLTKLPSETLFSDSWVCVVWRDNHEVGDKLTLQQWSELPHVCYGFGTSGIVLADLMLGALAPMRTRQVVCESFVILPLLLQKTRLIAMLPARLARALQGLSQVRIVQCPMELPEFLQAMTWSPLYDNDPAHTWLRGEISAIARRL